LSLFGRMSSCQFFWIVTCSPMPSKFLALEVLRRGHHY
jgi:hypothetical protein